MVMLFLERHLKELFFCKQKNYRREKEQSELLDDLSSGKFLGKLKNIEKFA